MNQKEVFAVWAPPNSLWSQWVAPVLFAQTDWSGRIKPEAAPPQHLPWLETKPVALVIDLPGAGPVDVGFAATGRGFRPIPLYNASPAPEEVVGLSATPGLGKAVIDMGPIVDAIARFTESLRRIELPSAAPPAFLLDSQRLVGTRPADQGMFDNRWMVFPQDFPSAQFLLSHGIRQALLVQKDRLEPQDDLAHSLLRWQEGGITVFAKKLDDSSPPSQIVVKRPSRYKAIWYRALAQLGLRRGSAGGFGSYIPQPTAAG